MKNPTKEIKKIEKCCNGKHRLCRAKLEVLKEWEQREKEILDAIYSDDIDWGSYIKGSGDYFDSKSFINKELKPRIFKGEKK